jgi:hypothetical protein
MVGVLAVCPDQGGGPAFAAYDGPVIVICARASSGDAEEQHFNVPLLQAGHPVEDLLFQGFPDLQQPVLRPMARVVGGGGQAIDEDVLADPVGGWQDRRGKRRFATSANSTRSAEPSRPLPARSRRADGPMPSRFHSASSAHTPPSARDSVNSSPCSAAASASSGPENWMIHSIRRRSASRPAESSAPTLPTTLPPVGGVPVSDFLSAKVRRTGPAQSIYAVLSYDCSC